MLYKANSGVFLGNQPNLMLAHKTYNFYLFSGIDQLCIVKNLPFKPGQKSIIISLFLKCLKSIKFEALSCVEMSNVSCYLADNSFVFTFNLNGT